MLGLTSSGGQAQAITPPDETQPVTQQDADSRETEARLRPFEQEQKQTLNAAARPLPEIAQELGALRRINPLVRSAAEQVRLEELEENLVEANRRFNAKLDKILAALAEPDAASARERHVKHIKRNLSRLVSDLSEQSGKQAALAHYLVSDERLDILLTLPALRIARQVAVDRATLARETLALHFAVRDLSTDPTEQAQALYEHLLAPIAADLEAGGVEVLMLNRDGFLREVPFAALHDGEQYLIERYALTIYGDETESNLRDAPAPKLPWNVAALGVSKTLPAVPVELEGIVKRDADDPDGLLPGRILLNEAFTRESLRTLLAEGFSVLHIASHFALNRHNEDDSFLLLGDGKRLTLKNLHPEWTANDLRFWGLDLLTLSACGTAVAVPLTEYMGAKAVLATLWPVNDAITARMMRDFYRRLTEQGLTKAQALQQAQLALIGSRAAGESGRGPRGVRGILLVNPSAEDTDERTASADHRYAHPYYWAPFILTGNWL